MPEMNLDNPDLHIVLVDHVQKTKKKYKNVKRQDLRYIYQNKLDKVCFQIRRKSSDKILRDKAFDIAKNPKYDQYQRGFASMIYEFFDKKTSAKRANNFAGSGIKNENISGQQLAEEFHKEIIKKFKKKKYNHLS